MENLKSLTEVLKLRSCEVDKGITFIEDDNNECFISYMDLYDKALNILYNLQSAGIRAGDEVVLQIYDSQMYISVFWACILGNMIPVPVPMDNNDELRMRIFGIWKILNGPYLVTDRKWLKILKEYSSKYNREAEFKEIEESTVLIEELQIVISHGVVFESKPNDIVAIQFSSGSTGEPKGVMLNHENLLVNSRDLIKAFGITDKDSSLSWLPLTHSFALILIHLTNVVAGINQFTMPTELFVKQPVLWMKKANQHGATMLYSPTFGYKHFLEFYKLENVERWDLGGIRLICNAAEPISEKSCRDFFQEMEKQGMKKNVMVSLYGLTECTAGVSVSSLNEELKWHCLDRNYLDIGDRVIDVDRNNSNCVSFVDEGCPLESCSVGVFDRDDNRLQDDVVGRIKIKGKSVTSGYYNNNIDTKRIKNVEGWLNTGDLGFIRNGRLIITGREKDIIFVNGQNFYLYDIERVAEEAFKKELKIVVACGVFNDETQKDDLVVFVLSMRRLEEIVPLALQLKRCINEKIGIVVKQIVPVNDMPKTPTGKIQRYMLGKRYKNGEYDSIIREMNILIEEKLESGNIIVPMDEIEEKLARIWMDVLKIDKIDMEDRFFKIGGNSLNLAMIISRIQKEFDIEFSIQKFFELSTIRSIANIIRTEEVTKRFPIKSAGNREFYHLSFAQQRMFIANQLEVSNVCYNTPLMIIVKGDLDRQCLELAFKKLVKRHEVFRTSFEIRGNEPVQIIHNNVNFNVGYMELEQGTLDEYEVEKLLKSFVQHFDLNIAPILKVQLLKLEDKKYLLMLDTHHIVWDGTSIGIFLRELTELYEGKILPEPKLQYKDFCEWQREMEGSDFMKSREEYWVNKFSGEIPVLNMPTDYPRPSIFSFEGDEINFTLGRNLTNKLYKITMEAEATIYMVILASYNVLLNKYTDQDDIVVGGGITGRVCPEIQNTIGMFVNMLAIRNFPSGEKTFRGFLKEVKENALEAYENQHYQFDHLVNRLNIKRDPSRNPMFDVVLVMQNMDIPKINIKGTTFTIHDFNERNSAFDIVIQVFERDEDIKFKLQFCTKLFKKETMEKFSERFIRVISQVANNMDIKIKDISILEDEEKKKVISPIKVLEDNVLDDFNF